MGALDRLLGKKPEQPKPAALDTSVAKLPAVGDDDGTIAAGIAIAPVDPAREMRGGDADPVVSAIHNVESLARRSSPAMLGRRRMAP